MKRIIAFFLFLAMLFVPIAAYHEADTGSATPTDLDPKPVDLTVEKTDLEEI